MNELEGRWDQVGGFRMYARVGGPAGAGRGTGLPPVVLVHGLSVSSRYMVPTAERLAQDFRVYAPNLPGFGRSEDPAEVLGVAELAGVLAEWMRIVGTGPAVLVGNSLGCQIVTHLAAGEPELAGAVVLVGPTADPAGRTLPRLIARAAVDVLLEDRALYPILIRDYARAGIRRTWQTLEHLVRDRPEELLPHVHVPALVVRGARDLIVPQAWAEEVVRLLPQGRLLVVPEAAHAVNFGAPDALAAAVRELAREAERGLTGSASRRHP